MSLGLWKHDARAQAWVSRICVVAFGVLCAQLFLPDCKAGSASDCQRQLKDGRVALDKKYGKLAIDVYKRLLKECPHTSETLFGMGMALKIDGKAAQAQDYLEQALRKDKKHEQTLIELGEILTWKDSSRERGIELLRQAVQQNPKSARANKLLGLTLSWRRPTLGEAVTYLSKAEELIPGDHDVGLALARALLWTGNRADAEKYYKVALKLQPTDTDAMYELALLESYDQGRREEALKLLQKNIELAPRNTQARFAQAMVTAWSGHYRDAIKTLRKLAQENPKLRWQQGTGADSNLSIDLALARVLSWNREYDEAEQVLKRILEEEPDYLAAKRELGMILSYQYARREEAVPILTEVCQRMPDDKEAVLALAQAHVAMRNPEKARPLIEHVLAQQPENPLAHKIQGNLHAITREPEKAVASLEKARSLGLFDADTAHALAGSYLAIKKAEEAEQVARAGLSEGAEDPRLQLALAKALIAQHRTDEGLTLLRKLAQTEQLRELAKISEEFAGPSETRAFSIELCRQELQLEPKNTYCLWSLGKVLSWNDATREEGLKYLGEYCDLKPDDIEGRRYYAEVLSWTGKKKEALARYDTLLEIKPDNLDVQASRAQVLSWMGHINPAIKQYRSILKLNPKQKEALVGLGQCLNWRGDNLKADAVFKKAISIFPDAPDVVLEQALNYQRLGRIDLALRGANRTIELFEVEKNM